MIELAAAMMAGGATLFLLKPRSSYLAAPRTRSWAGDRTDAGGTTRSKLATILDRLGRSSPLEHARLDSFLASSGAEVGAAPMYRGASLLLGASGLVVGLAFGPLSLVASPALGAVGFRLPLIWLQAKARARSSAISEGLPEALDLLVVCVSAGLNLSLALDRVALRTPGPLGAELKRVRDLVGLGVSRRQALSEMESRSGSSEVTALVSALVTTDRFGSSVAGSLEALASDLRAGRRRAAEEQARRAPVKMLFPLVFLILPAFILLTIVPLLLGTFRTLGL